MTFWTPSQRQRLRSKPARLYPPGCGGTHEAGKPYLTFPGGAGILDLPVPPAALLRPGGYQGVMQTVIPHTLVIPRFIVVSHVATPFLCSVLGVASPGAVLFISGYLPLTLAIIDYIRTYIGTGYCPKCTYIICAILYMYILMAEML